MQSLWQKLWFYTRMVVTVLITINVALFVILNFGTRIEGDINFNFFTKFERPRLLVVLFVTAFVSILGWWLFWTVFRTIRQIRAGVERGRVERLTREVEEMKLKAARLQTKAAANVPSTEIDSPPPPA
ncbi:MAG: hypothetical protein NZ561_04455 [Phycisphaerae bacterium]|nr:hypothetical protein [Phycisphaerae bacterium]MDW8261623.1 hypothetical protein [Phycisphaerales bacterium]